MKALGVKVERIIEARGVASTIETRTIEFSELKCVKCTLIGKSVKD